MRYALLLGAFCGLAETVQAQTLEVTVGNVTYRYNAAECGDMIYNNGTTLTILDKTYTLADVSNVKVTTNSVAENAIDVIYNGASAQVVIPGKIAAKFSTATVSGANVTLVQDDTVTDEITYTLTGTSDNGSFYMDGKLKATVVFDNLTLTNPSGAAVNIRDGKRIDIEINGTNTLADGTASTDKAALMVKGHSEITGDGTLNLAGYAGHAFWGDEYVQLKKKMTGTINITKAVKDGMNINQYFKMNGGNLKISGVGDDGIQVSMEDSDEADDGKILISGGSLDIAITAAGAKCLKADSTIVISDGTLTLSTAGGVDTSDSSDPSVSACIKSDVEVIVTGGTLNATITGAAAKGISSDGAITISGGNLTLTNSGDYVAVTTDDIKGASCLKTDGDLIITGGTIVAESSGQGGKAISSDGAIDIRGGEITASAKGSNYGSSSGGFGGGGGGFGGGGQRPGGGGGFQPGQGSTSSNHKYAKGIKADGNLTISGGTVTVSSANHEGMESKGVLTITDGIVNVTATDDAINSASNMVVTGGNIYAFSSGNDALDANGNMSLEGGVIMAFASTNNNAESGIDIDESHNLTIKGGEIFSIGGRNDFRNSGSTQSYTTHTSTLSAGGYAIVSSNGKNLFAVKVPANYSNKTGIVSSSRGSGNFTITTSSSASGTAVNNYIEY